MRWSSLLSAGGIALAGLLGPVGASEPRPSIPHYRPAPAAPGCLVPMPPTAPGVPPAPGAPGMPPAPGTAPEAPSSLSPGDFGTPGGEAGGASLAGIGNMIGDFVGVPFRTTQSRTVDVITRLVINGVPNGEVNRIPNGGTQNVPVTEVSAGRTAFKITESESPLPVDRIFVNYNYYYNVPFVGGSVGETAIGAPRPTGIPGVDLQDFLAPATVVNRQIRIHRETFGFEKTFFGGDASVGVRVPVFQVVSSFDSATDIGDISMMFKYALLLDRCSGNAVSVGMVVTAPTGPTIQTNVGGINSWLIQPWAGYRFSSGDAYVQGFTSVIVPTDSRDTTLLLNDVGLGYFLLRPDGCRTLSTAIAFLEGHLTTPLNHRGADAPVAIPDLFVITTGVHLGLGRYSVLSVGVASPVTGPRLFDLEAFAHLSLNF